MKKEAEEYCIKEFFYEEANVDSLKEIKQDGVRLQEYLERSSNVVISKAHYIFRIVLVIVSALIGYIISKGENWDLSTITLTIFTLAFVIVLLLLRRVAYGIDIFDSLGTEPKFVLQEDIFNNDNNEINYKELLRFNIQNIQRGITKNIKIHEKLVTMYSFASWSLIVVLFLIPVILAIVNN